MEKLNYLAQLNLLVRSVEVDLGISDVTASEKAILSAVSLLLYQQATEVPVQTLLEHELVKGIPKPRCIELQVPSGRRPARKSSVRQIHTEQLRRRLLIVVWRSLW